MHFQIAEQLVLRPAAPADAVRIAAEGFESVRQRRPVRVRQREPGRVPGAGDGTAAQQGGPEAGTLLVAEPHEVDMERKARPGSVQQRHGLQPQKNAEDTVVLAGIRHGIQVRTEDQAGSAGAIRLQRPPQIPRLVLAVAEARIDQPPGHALIAAAVLGRQVGPADRAGETGDSGQFIAPFHDAPGGSRQSFALAQEGRDGISHRHPARQPLRLRDSTGGRRSADTVPGRPASS